MSLTGEKPVLLTDVGKAMKNIAAGKPALSDDPEYDAENDVDRASYDVENVQEPEKQSMIKTKYVAVESDDITFNLFTA